MSISQWRRLHVVTISHAFIISSYKRSAAAAKLYNYILMWVSNAHHNRLLPINITKEVIYRG